MKRFVVLFLMLLAAPLIVAQSCTAQNPPSVRCTNCDGIGGSGTAMSVQMSLPPRTCTITFTAGNITTEGCDFSMPMNNPKITPGGADRFKIVFEQPYSSLPTMSTTITPSR